MSEANPHSLPFPYDGLSFAGSSRGGGLQIQLLPDLDVVRVMAFQNQMAGLSVQLNAHSLPTLPAARQSVVSSDLVVAWAAKNCWFFLGSRQSGELRKLDLPGMLAGLAAVSDAGDGFASLQLTGRDGLRLMTKGCSLDLDEMPVRAAQTTVMAHVNVHLIRLAEDRFQILVPASCLDGFWTWLILSSEEFGYDFSIANRGATQHLEPSGDYREIPQIAQSA